AYKNLEFLTSPDAISLRILAEFLEPNRRFRDQNIKDTIVFFGSARFVPRPQALKQLKAIEDKYKSDKKLSDNAKKQLADAQVDLEMSGFYEDASTLAFLLTEWALSLHKGDHLVVCSGGGPGIMEAANRGATQAGGKTIGLNISLPMEQYVNPYVPPELNFEFHYFFMRKFWFMYIAQALIMFPGGFGTMDELMEILTLVQTRKVRRHVPIVLYSKKYWTEIVNFDSLIKYRVISEDDMNLFRFADTPEEAFEYLKKDLLKNYLKPE
ncbi:MAG TPA: TIGR00730 family Rossman fold protein, partial [Bacteroidota bacterium]|nr:TIGR00730 family Rossman fold protein [Bacteroidota bacterium]